MELLVHLIIFTIFMCIFVASVVSLFLPITYRFVDLMYYKNQPFLSSCHNSSFCLWLFCGTASILKQSNLSIFSFISTCHTWKDILPYFTFIMFIHGFFQYFRISLSPPPHLNPNSSGICKSENGFKLFFPPPIAISCPNTNYRIIHVFTDLKCCA